MNWLDGLALISKFRAFWAKFANIKVGEERAFLIRTRIAGRMWRFTGKGSPED